MVHGCVVIESPFAGDEEFNLTYLRACMRDCLLRGEAPYASHGLYTQPGVLIDSIPADRKLGIEAGLHMAIRMDFAVFYMDLGVSLGMHYAMDCYKEIGFKIVERRLPEDVFKELKNKKPSE